MRFDTLEMLLESLEARLERLVTRLDTREASRIS